MMGSGFCLLCFSALFFFVLISLCLAASIHLHDLSRRDLGSPSCRIPVLHSHLHGCHYLLSPSSWQGVLCLSQQPTRCQQTHFTEKYIPKTCGFFQWLREKIFVQNKQNHEDQHPSAAPSSQCTLVLNFSRNISGSLDSATGSASSLIFHSNLRTSITSRSLGKQKYLSSYMKILFIYEKKVIRLLSRQK